MASSSATFERAGVAVTATYRGARLWTVGANRFDNRAVSAEVRNALQLAAGVLPPATRIEVRAEHIRHGAIANNTFPPTAWWFDVDPGAGGVAADLDAAIWECLVALRLSPSDAHRRSPFVDPSFRVDALNAAPQPVAWASELERRAQDWFGVDASIDDVHDFMSQLRALGHPLYSFDESDDFVTWSTWGPERPRRRLDVDVRLPAYDAPAVTVTVTVRDNDDSPPASARARDES